jgi:hypothetical protein
MPLVRFTSSPKLPRDWANKPYVLGYECEMSQDEADRWVRRNCILILPSPSPSLVKEPEIEVVVLKEVEPVKEMVFEDVKEEEDIPPPVSPSSRLVPRHR